MRAPGATSMASIVPRGMAAALALLAVGGACTALEEFGAKEPSPTGGVTLSLSIRRPAEQSYELFRVTRRGELEFGGGLRAFNDSTNWTGAMTEEEIRAFLDAVERSGWCREAPPSDHESSIRCRIEIRCADARHTWEVRGEPQSVVEMRALLDPIARRRLAPDLERLPEASERRAMTRGAGTGATAAPRERSEAEGAGEPDGTSGANGTGGASGTSRP